MVGFERYIGIDYSGAQTPDSSLKGLRVYMADKPTPPFEVAPPPSPRKYWTRREVAEWLEARLSEDAPSLVGIDHGFSFPLKYFEKHQLPLDWPVFLEDFCFHWPTAEENMYVRFVRDGLRSGDRRWRRLAEVRAGGAKSVFHFDVPGAVANSTHAGLPWLLYLRNRLKKRIHFWPFDGWKIPEGKSVLAEVYPSLWSKSYPREQRDQDQQDAYSIAAWMRQADANGSLAGYFDPHLVADERKLAEIEGWILGVTA